MSEMKTAPITTSNAGTLSVMLQNDIKRVKRQIFGLEDMLKQEMDDKSREICKQTLKELKEHLVGLCND